MYERTIAKGGATKIHIDLIEQKMETIVSFTWKLSLNEKQILARKLQSFASELDHEIDDAMNGNCKLNLSDECGGCGFCCEP